MQIKTISYRRVNNLGNYNSEHLEMFAELEDGEEPISAAKVLKACVEESLGLKPKEPPAKLKEQAPVYREPQPQPSNDNDDKEFKF